MIVPFRAGTPAPGATPRSRDPDGLRRNHLGRCEPPFAIASQRNRRLFFRFNAARVVEWGILWFVGCRSLLGRTTCGGGRRLNAESAVLFVPVACLSGGPDWPASPTFRDGRSVSPAHRVPPHDQGVLAAISGFWLLPWFALVGSDMRLFPAFEAADVAVFFTEFSRLGRQTGFGGLPAWPLELAVLVRAAVLLTYLILFVLRPQARGEGVDRWRTTLLLARD
jgi:hypothetical protein